MEKIGLISERYNSYMFGHRARHPWYRWNDETQIPPTYAELGAEGGTDFEKNVYMAVASQNTVATPSETLASVMIPKEEGGYTEADVIHISEYGIFVIEAKDWRAKVGGSFSEDYLAVYFENRDTVEMTFNPVEQNRRHINALENFLYAKASISLPNIVFHNIVVFSGRTDFSNVQVTKETVEYRGCVMNSPLLVRDGLYKVCSTSWPVYKYPELDVTLIERIYQVLNMFCPKDQETRRRHKESVSAYQ